MITSEITPVSFQDSLPSSVDVAVIGAGIIGVCTAWHLVQQGVSVLICEKGRVAGEQSSRNWGWIRQQGRDPAELPIMMDSIRTWDKLADLTGEDVGFSPQGSLYLAKNDRELAKFEQWLEVARQHDLDTRILTGRQVNEMINGNQSGWHGALYTASDGRAEPDKAVPALARAAQRQGCTIIENCAVRVVDTRGGEVCGVVTERGTVQAQRVVCAGGAWSSLFLRNAGVDFPQLMIRATVARTTPAPNVFSGNAASGSLAFRRRADGGYSVALADFLEHYISIDSFRYFRSFFPSLRASWSHLHLRTGDGPWRALAPGPSWDGGHKSPFEQTRVLNPEPSRWAVAQMRKRLAEQLPALAGIEFEESWAGMIDTTPDVVPVMDNVAGYPGLYLAAGFSGHGFGIGPGAGQVMANLVTGRQVAYDLTRFRLPRFSDGSAIELGPAL
jgi:glycine/D-amino acid oxidase-like deaminating enzyme